MSTYFIYARKSTESEDRQALSIDAQVNELRQYAETHNLTVTEVFIESKSAKRSGRPIFLTMLKALKNPKVSGILCWKLDRLSRNLADAALLSEAMDDGLLQEIRTPSQTFKNTSTDRFMSGMEWLVSRKYVDDLSDNVKRGFRAKVQSGWFPGQAPLGYFNDRNQPQGQRKILKDIEKFPLIRRLWSLMLTGRYTVPQVLEIAWKFGITTRNGRYPAGKPVSRSGLYKIFTNVFYAGLFEYKGEIFEGKHPPMVTLDEFDKVQELLGRKGKPRPKKNRFTFVGLLRCGECGAAITAEEKFKFIKSTGGRRRYLYYHCTHRLKTPCRQRSITEDELKRQVDAYLSTITLPQQYLDFVLKHLDEYNGNEEVIAENGRHSANEEISKIDRRLENLLAMKISPDNESGTLLSDSEYLTQKAALLKQKNRLRATETDERIINDKVTTLTKETFEFATYARAWFANGGWEKQRVVLNGIGSNQTLRDGMIAILAKEPFTIIARQLSLTNKNCRRLEPKNHSVNSKRNRGRNDQSLLLYNLVSDVRKAIIKSLSPKG